MVRRFLLAGILGFCIGNTANGGEHRFTSAEPVSLNPMPVVVSASAQASVRKSAERLAGILRRSGSGKFNITTGNGNEGIALGTVKDFPGIDFHPYFDDADLAARQGYEIKSHPKGIWVIGASPQALDYAVSDLLQRVGYRRYFPSTDWEILPRNLSFGGHIRETPDYYHRRIWSNFGVRPEMRADTALWEQQQRMGGFALDTGHSYERFIRLHRKEFDEHPEYYGLVDGKRTSSKMCISNPGLRKLFIDYALAAFEKYPELESFSADPSDMQKWCECPECARLGSPSNRAVLLANVVAEAVNRKYHDKIIGIYAYNYHSPPPDIDVHPGVVVSIAKAFIHGGYTHEELLRGWKARKAVLGIREYYDVILWWKELPGLSAASNRKYVADSIPRYYRMGARYFSAESGDDWGPGGLGYYLAARMLWNIEENPESVMEDFYKNCFGKAAGPAKKIYELLNGSHKYPLTEDWLGQVYREMADARRMASENQAVMKRLDALSIYLRYAELYHRFEMAASKDKAAAFAEWMNFVARNRDCRMVHSMGLFREQKRLAPNEFKKTPLPISWKPPLPPPTEAELAKFVSDGIANNALVDFEAVDFGQDLVPVAVSGKKEVAPPGPLRGTREFLIWSDGTPLELKVTGGLIKHYRDRGNVKLSLVQIGGVSETGELETTVAHDESVPPDGKERSVILRPKHAGLHRVVSSDGGDMTNIIFPEDSLLLSPGGAGKQVSLSGIWFFYVPKGTERLGFYAKMPRCTLYSPDGKQVANQAYNGYYSIPAKPGVWKVAGTGIFQPLTVPSGLSFRSDKMLLPREVAGKDFPKQNHEEKK